MPEYTRQQSWVVNSFPRSTTLCTCDCDCGRVHFASARGHGDYEDGELAGLQEKAAKEPEKYIEHAEFHYVDQVRIDGRWIVPDCPCNKLQRYIDWIETHAEGLSRYLGFYLKEQRADALEIAKDARRLLRDLKVGPKAAAQGSRLISLDDETAVR